MATKKAKSAGKTAKKAVKKTTAKAATKAAPKAKASKKTAEKAADKAQKPQTLSKAPAAKATKKKVVRGRVKSVATLKRAGLLRGKQTNKKARNSAPEKLVEAQLEKLALKWEALHAKADAIPSETYNMRKTYQPHTGLKHKTLGWGFIIDNKNDRLEVLFKDGIRYLISNYNS